MKKLLYSLIGVGILFISIPSVAFAAESSPITQYTTDILGTLTLLASLASTVFLIKGGYSYITSTGNPQSLESAKKTIKNSLIGLALVIGASSITTLLTHIFQGSTPQSTSGALNFVQIQPASPQGGVAQVMIDGIAGLVLNLIQSGGKSLVNGFISLLTTTPSLVTNFVVFNFWLVIVGITDTLFAILIALLGFHVISASAFGYEEVDLKHVLSRVGIAFLGANVSLFLIDRIIGLSNALIQAILQATGGLSQAFLLNLLNPATFAGGPDQVGLLVLLFMLLFLALTVVLLLYYIGRLIILAIGAVLSPLVFLLWALPAGADFAKIVTRSYLVTIFTVFIHVVTIQLASSFLTVTNQSGTNSFVSILVGIALFSTLIKIPGMLINMTFYASGNAAVRAIGGQIMNVFSSKDSTEGAVDGAVKTPRREVAL